MSHLFYDFREAGSEFSDYVFSKVPELPFEVIDGGICINARTDWGNTPLRGDMVRFFWQKFIADERLITSHGALTFLNARDMSPEALSGAFNVIMNTINPQWLENLFGSPLRQLEPELCYGISPSAASFFPVFRFENFILLLSLAFNYSL